MPQKQVFFSVDGGGSKTEFCVHDIERKFDRIFTFGSTNYKTVGVDAAKKNLVVAFNKICAGEGIALPQIAGMVIGLSGFDSEIDMRVFREMALSLGLPEEKMFLCNDCELAFRAAANPPGICTVAGTGSIAFGFDKTGIATRCGGWGGLLSDDGSGYWIAREVLRRMLTYCDGIGGYEPVFDVLREYYGSVSFSDIPEVFTHLNITDIAACAKPIMDFALEGDTFCGEIVREAARLVSQLTISLGGRIDIGVQPEISFVVTGGLFRNVLFYGHYLACLENHFQSEIKLLNIKEGTSQNGIRLAAKLFG